jgi:isopentenyl-diphosphate delta-isomerase
MKEEVVLVDENDQEIGRMLKSEVHGSRTPLHKAFSSFIFNDRGEILLQQRAHSKKTWPLVWSNSCCGHPLPNESREQAVVRRIQDELGISIEEKDVVFMSPYRYQFVRDGVMENEICPIYVIHSNIQPISNPDEVEAIKWMKWEEYVHDTVSNPNNWSEWCVEEVALLNSSDIFKHWLDTITEWIR